MTKRISYFTQPFRLAFPALFEAREFKGKSKYEATALFPKSDFPAKKDIKVYGVADRKELPLIQVVAAELARRFGEGWRELRVNSPFKDGDVDANPDWIGVPGTWFLRMSSIFRPGIFARDNTPIRDPMRVYGGCWVRAQIHVFAYDEDVNRGAGIGLNSIQFVRDDEPFGGTGESSFDPLDDPGATEGATEGSAAGRPSPSGDDLGL